MYCIDIIAKINNNLNNCWSFFSQLTNFWLAGWLWISKKTICLTLFSQLLFPFFSTTQISLRSAAWIKIFDSGQEQTKDKTFHTLSNKIWTEPRSVPYCFLFILSKVSSSVAIINPIDNFISVMKEMSIFFQEKTKVVSCSSQYKYS